MYKKYWQRCAAAACLCVGLWSAPVHAQTPSVDSVTTLLQLEGYVQATDVLAHIQSLDTVSEFLAQEDIQGTPAGVLLQEYLDAAQAAKAQLPAAAVKDVEALILQMMRSISHLYSWDAMREDLLRIYQRTYTQAEVDAWVTFYQTPVGQRIVRKRGQITVALAPVYEQKLQSLMPHIHQFERAMHALEKKYPAVPVVPVAPAAPAQAAQSPKP